MNVYLYDCGCIGIPIEEEQSTALGEEITQLILVLKSCYGSHGLTERVYIKMRYHEVRLPKEIPLEETLQYIFELEKLASAGRKFLQIQDILLGEKSSD